MLPTYLPTAHPTLAMAREDTPQNFAFQKEGIKQHVATKMRILWGMVIHFVAYRVHVEGTNREIINISDFKFIKSYNKYNEVNVLIFKYTF
jgi:hypothetical protein